MLKNLKIDIIYYNTPSDFEFEFNLGGYCRSRILNAKATNIKEALTKLALAVTRSRVIIIIGELLGENGCIAPVAKAISKPLVAIDHRQYHITSPEPINLIEGSVPLASSDGEFGGCIIESGPQSIIFLTENKALRSVITEELVSHYLSTLSQTSDAQNDVIKPESVAKENAAETEEIEEVAEEITTEEIIEPISEDPIIVEEPLQEGGEDKADIETEAFNEIELADNEQDSDKINEDTESNESEYIDIYSDVNKESEETDMADSLIIPLVSSSEQYENENYYNAKEQQEDYISEDDEEVFEEKKQKAKEPLSPLSKTLICLLAVFLVVLAAIAYFTVYLPGLDGVSAFEFFERVFATRII